MIIGPAPKRSIAQTNPIKASMAANALLFGERRQYIRKDCLRLIGINDFSKLYSGYLRDLALGGAFLEYQAENASKVGQELILSIPFGLKKGYVHVHAKVARVQYYGFGVRFLNSKKY